MSSAEARWLDGEPLAEAWALDRGLHYGDGLFETMVLRQGRIRFGAAHQQRLASGCQRLRIACDAQAALAQAQALAGPGDALLKLIVTRGLATQRGYAPSGDERARSLLLRYPLPSPSAQPSFNRVAVLTTTLGENPLLAGLKHLNRLELVLASAERAERGLEEGLLCSSSGHLICGTASNVFLVSQGQLYTPKVDRCGIAGVMRSVVLRTAPELGLPVIEDTLTREQLATADEVFITNVRLGVSVVSEVEGRAMPPAPVALALKQWIDALAH